MILSGLGRGLSGLFRLFGEASSRRFVRVPFTDPEGRKGVFERLTRAPAHRVTRVTMRVPGWPATPRPLRVIFLSDFHTGSHARDVQRFADIVVEANELRPDLVCLGGDYVNRTAYFGGRVPPETTAAILAGLAAPLGIFAVLGNHDWRYDGEGVRAALEAVGIRVLENEAVPVRFADRTIYIAGVADAITRAPDVRGTLATLPPGAPALVLAHNPASFADLPPGPYVMLSGHTHGGQFHFPFIGPVTNMSEAPLEWTYGLVEADGRRLYVTSGLGTSALPLRLGIRPEIVRIEIEAAQAPEQTR